MPPPDQAILLTPPGSAAIAVVRVAGPGVPDFLARHFSKPARLHRTVHGDLHDGGRVIDDPVVVLVDERSADVNLHGGPWVVRATLELLERSGFEVVQTSAAALPERAVDADAPIWREVLTDLPRAKTELAVRALLAQPAAWDGLLADPPSADEVRAMLADRTMDRLLATPRVAIVGPANAGKSTLANQLFGRERSITADLPGTTRDWVGELANVGGVAVMLVDTPGLRVTDDAIEQAAIERAREQVTAAEVVVVVLDAARPLDEEQRRAVAGHPGAVVAINKTDRPAAWDVASLGERVQPRAGGYAGGPAVPSADAPSEQPPQVIPIVARSGVGVDALSAAILRRLGCGDLAPDKPRCWTARQRGVLDGLVRKAGREP